METAVDSTHDRTRQEPLRLTAKIGERGQVTIPKALRQRYGLKPGAEVEFVEDAGALVVRRTGDIREAIRSIMGTVKLDVSVDEYIEEMRGR